MAIEKEHKEFYSVDLESGWSVPEGYDDGFEEKILAGHLDTKSKRGNRTRLLRLLPGTFSTAPFIHDYWEEVYLVSGDLIVGNDDQGNGGESFDQHTYACRPPGTYHGPFKSVDGCVLMEIHYYEESP